MHFLNSHHKFTGRLCSIVACIGLFVLTGCGQLPDIDEPANLSVQEGERLQESDFALLISNRSGLITYLGTDGNVYVTDQTGQVTTPITADANATSLESFNNAPEIKYYLLPTWSTAGQKLAFAQHHIRNESGQNVAQLQRVALPTQNDSESARKSTFTIFATNGDGTDTHALWEGEARPIYMYWAPNGETLSAILQPQNAGSLQFVVMSAADQSVDVLDIGAPLFWDWSPTSQQIMTHIGSGDGLERMGLLSLDGQVVEEIFDFELARFSSPDISPDGRLVAFPTRSEEDDDDDTWVSVFDFGTREKRVIERLDGDLLIDATFSPEGKHLAYVATKTSGPARGELAVYSLETGKLFVSNEKRVTAFFWSPDSQKIAWFERAESDLRSVDLNVLDLNSGESVLLMTGIQTTPQFAEVLSFHNQYQRSATIWSPDSRTVVFPMVQGESTVIVAMDAGGKIEPRRLGEGVVSFWSAE
ncbi:MAG: hypothetical protein AAF902_09070 [Chloroflexota bacterium]